MTVTSFVNRKALQLVFFIRGFWDNRIPYTEMNLYFWDTLEEWAQVEEGKSAPCSREEQVFWHLLHQIHFWPEQKLLLDDELRAELNICMDFLEGQGHYPFDCIGIRP